MKRTRAGLGRLGIAVVAMVLVAGCTEPSLSEPEVQASAGKRPDVPVVEEPAPPHPPAEAAVPPRDAGTTKPFAFEVPARGDAPPAHCRLDGFVMPANAKVYAAGAYAGKKTDFQIDDSGHEATSIQVAVNEPNAPVALLLGAYEPTVWSIGWTRGTRIVAVVLTGYHRQQLTGLPADVPLLVSTYDNRGPCGYAYVGGEGDSKLNPLARNVFARPVDIAYLARDGRAMIGSIPPGAALVTDGAARPVQDFKLKDTPLAGQAGIDAAVRDGILRATVPADLRAWSAARERGMGAPDVPRIEGGSASSATDIPYRSYTVLKAFAIPAGLHGAHAATFFVAAGVPAPTGDPGHSEIRYLENGGCVGFSCGRR